MARRRRGQFVETDGGGGAGSGASVERGRRVSCGDEEVPEMAGVTATQQRDCAGRR